MCSAAETMKTVVLTTEEEGIALCTGAWLGGERYAVISPADQQVVACLALKSVQSRTAFKAVVAACGRIVAPIVAGLERRQLDV